MALFRKLAFLFFVLVIFSPLATAAAGDADNDGIPDSEEQELAERHSPILYFASGERLYPVEVEYFLENSDLKQFLGSERLVSQGPLSASEISPFTVPGEEYFLDFRPGSAGDEKVIEEYEKSESSLGYTVYARVALDSYSSKTVVQYWFFYAFNPGRLNVHEGDWETVQVFLDSDGKPEFAAFSQHEGGELVAWADVEKSGAHPKVFVALGSHANYAKPFEGAVGLASDKVAANGTVLEPKDYEMVMLGEKGAGNHSAEQGWIDFSGHWGEYGALEAAALGQRGPLGPAFHSGNAWGMPAAWSSGLMQGTQEWFTWNWIAYNFVLLFLLYVAVRVLISALGILRKKKRAGLGPRIFSLFYIDGVNAKSLGNVLCIVSVAVALFAVFQPWFYVNADISSEFVATQGKIALVTIDGINGVLVNWFAGNGIVQMFGLGIPFGVVIAAGFFIFVLGTVGVNSTGKAGRKYISRGIANAIPVILILAVVMQLPSLIAGVEPLLSQQIPAEAMGAAESVFEEIASSPFSGAYAQTIEYGPGTTAQMGFDWGLGFGACLLLLAAVLAIVAGALEIAARAEFFRSGK